ncbi:Uncharacterised protein [Dermatophilus congolensis]|uniref:DUF4282 domain-containing protein n=1 Tax=Dermatophilus congolensis TaxID=1863 RepID=A0AA46H132_9MICO|nr:DUF4282 domain-containing protein [Dermatophilus congolensis]STD13367.1 Uncharacterised protein [Dermatophilus congolensis]
MAVSSEGEKARSQRGVSLGSVSDVSGASKGVSASSSVSEGGVEASGWAAPGAVEVSGSAPGGEGDVVVEPSGAEGRGVSDGATLWHLSGAPLPSGGDGWGVNASSGWLRPRADPFVYGKGVGGQRSGVSVPVEESVPAGDEAGVWALADLSFQVRSTRALAPVVYVAALVVLVSVFVVSVYVSAMDAAASGSGLLGTGVTVVVGLAMVVLGGALMRLVLEFFCNVADVAAWVASRKER